MQRSLGVKPSSLPISVPSQPHELAAFRPERLIIHELLIRVMGDLAVSDGDAYEDLGINFRRITAVLLDGYIRPSERDLIAQFNDERERVAGLITAELERALFQRKEPPPSRDQSDSPTSFWGRLFGQGSKPPAPALAPPPSKPDRLHEALAHWSSKCGSSDDPCERASLEAIAMVVKRIAGKHGRIVGDAKLIARIATNQAMNTYGSRLLGQAIEPLFDKGVGAEGFRRLPAQTNPAVMNVKGASASGKSTLRPLQRHLAKRIGVPWHDFALISPDIWRKFLIDYDALGPAYKYAGTLAGHELEVIDRKLDYYMADKAAKGSMPHLLIDRFRFDSFTPETEREGPVRLLTRFGNLVYMFFMITPPAATVERAWQRGLAVGRYKAVDDLLAHNIEAYSGMPELFFTWALRTRKRVHSEFLDNSVELGQPPRTIAFGWNGEFNILDIKAMLDIDRFRKVDIAARAPDEVHRGHSMKAADNTDFLSRCVKMLPVINFANQETGLVYARLEGGHWIAINEDGLSAALADPDIATALTAIGLPAPDGRGQLERLSICLDRQGAHTVGEWGDAR